MCDVNIIMHILASLPKEYKVTGSVLKDRLMDSLAQVQFRVETEWEEIILHHNYVKQNEKDVLEDQAYAAFKKKHKARC